MVSTLYADGILTVEALVPKTSVPAATIIPIKVILSGRIMFSLTLSFCYFPLYYLFKLNYSAKGMCVENYIKQNR